MINHRFTVEEEVNFSPIFELLKPSGRIISKEKHPNKDLWLILLEHNRDEYEAVLWSPSTGNLLRKELKGCDRIHFLSEQLIMASKNFWPSSAPILFDYSLNSLTLDEKLQSAFAKTVKRNYISLDFKHIILANHETQMLYCLELHNKDGLIIPLQLAELPFLQLVQDRPKKPTMRIENNPYPAPPTVRRSYVLHTTLVRLTDNKFLIAGSDLDGSFLKECTFAHGKILPNEISSPVILPPGSTKNPEEINLSLQMNPMLDGRLAFAIKGHSSDRKICFQYFAKEEKSSEWKAISGSEKSYNDGLNSKIYGADITRFDPVFFLERVPLPFIAVTLHSHLTVPYDGAAALFNLETNEFVPQSKRNFNDMRPLLRPFYVTLPTEFYYPSETPRVYSKGQVVKTDPNATESRYLIEIKKARGLEYFPTDHLKVVISYLTLFKPLAADKSDIPTFPKATEGLQIPASQQQSSSSSTSTKSDSNNSPCVIC